MSAADREDLKEDICTELLLGKENGDAELETMARIVWLEQQKYLTLTSQSGLNSFTKEAFSQRLRNPSRLRWIGNALPILAKASFLSGRRDGA
jgi:hypothetical protein